MEFVGSKLSEHNKIKIERHLKAECVQLEEEGIDSQKINESLSLRRNELENLAILKDWTCPKVRFGKTELQMPIITLGGMRQQQTWKPPETMSLDDINKECQKNFEEIADRAIQLGINHFETARGYGSSELQFGPVIKKYSREAIILQTKVVPKPDADEFRKILETSFNKLQLKDEDSYVDLFSFHGINYMEQIDWILKPGGCMDVVKEYKAKGKIRHVGFSTHGMTPTILAAIETDAFDYCNIHYQFIGSYTAAGTGPAPDGGNYSVLQAAAKRDMGVFIISPTDKGGCLYKPSRRYFSNCLPLTPIAYNNLWLWGHSQIHTLVVGAARPSDFDEHVRAAMLLSDPNTTMIVKNIEKKFYDQRDSVMGNSFKESWFYGLPDAWQNAEGVPVAHFYWLWWIVKSWGMYEYAVARYNNIISNQKEWDDNKKAQENKKKFNFVPGVPYRPERHKQFVQSLECLGDRKQEVLDAIIELHHWCADKGIEKRAPSQVSEVEAKYPGLTKYWKQAVDLQPNVPFPERD